MANRLVSVGDDFTLPAAVKVANANLPDHVQPAALSATYDPLIDTLPCDIIIGAGQSNMSGRGTPYSDAAYAPNQRIVQYPSIGSGQPAAITVATNRLFMHDYDLAQATHGISPLLVFAREYAKTISPKRRVLLVPAANGGTGFNTSSITPLPSGYTSANGCWRPGGDGAGGINLYTRMIAQAQAALAAAPAGSKIVAMLWHQGESDSGKLETDYAFLLDDLITKTRTDLGVPALPVIVGQMTPEWIAGTSGAVDKAHINTPLRMTNTAFAYSIPSASKVGDTVHFATPGVNAMGKEMHAAFPRAVFNTTASVPVAPEWITGEWDATGNLNLKWQQPLSRVTSFLVDYSVNGGAWRADAVTTRTPVDARATIAGITAGATVRVRVRTRNSGYGEAVSAAQQFVAPSVLTVPAATLLLDAYPADRAYATRKLRTAYAGPLIRVRRASDNTELDISAAAGSATLDTAALLTFIGASDAFVTKMYDQSGNGFDLVQATAASQPKIATAGVLSRLDSGTSDVAALFDGVDDWLGNNNPLIAASSAAAILTVFRYVTSPGAAPTWISEGNSSNGFGLYRSDIIGSQLGVYIRNASEAVQRSGAAVSPAPGGLTGGSRAHSVLLLDTGAAISHRTSGAASAEHPPGGATRAGAYAVDRFTVGAQRRAAADAGRFITMAMTEIIVWGSDKAATAAAIEYESMSRYAISAL